MKQATGPGFNIVKIDLKKQTGASAVEFALLLPFLVLLVFGTIEFGLLLYNQQVLTNATREAARAAIVGHCSERLTDAEIGQIVTDYCLPPGNTARLITFNETNNPPATTVSPSPKGCTPGSPGSPGSGPGVGDEVSVTSQYTYTFLTPAILGFGPTKLLTGKTVMKMESAP